MAAQMASGQKINSSGKESNAKFWNVVGSGIEQRMSPLFSLAQDLAKWATTENAMSYGQEIGSTDWILGNMLPLPISNAISSFKQADNPLVAFSGTVSDFFGISANSYDSTPLKADKNTRDISISEKRDLTKQSEALYDIEKAKFRRSSVYKELTPRQRMQIDADLQVRANEVVKYRSKASKLKNAPLQPWEWVKKNRFTGTKNILKKKKK
jgi:hypothetical protein